MEITLNKPQETAVTSIVDFIKSPYNVEKPAVILCGDPGTGKTTVLKSIIERIPEELNVLACSFVNVAVDNMYLSFKAQNMPFNRMPVLQTIHSAFRLTVRDTDPKEYPDDYILPLTGRGADYFDVVIVDEDSMLPKFLLEALLAWSKDTQVKLIFAGDKNQLPPVGEKRSEVFHKNFIEYELTTLVRQKHPDLKNLVTTCKKSVMDKVLREIPQTTNVIFKPIQEGIKEFKDRCCSEEFTAQDCRLLGYRNKTVIGANQQVEFQKKGTIKPLAGDTFISNTYSSPPKNFLDSNLNHSSEYPQFKLGNAALRTIESVIQDVPLFEGEGIEDQIYGSMLRFAEGWIYQPYNVVKAIKTTIRLAARHDNVNADTNHIRILDEQAYERKKFKNNKKPLTDLKLNLKYFSNGIATISDFRPVYAQTVHKSQGQTVNTVYVTIKDLQLMKRHSLDLYLRAMYVALSRAKEQIIILY